MQHNVNAKCVPEDEDEDWNKPNTEQVPGNGLRQSKRVLRKLKANKNNDFQQIMMFAAKKTTEVPSLQITNNVS